MAEAITYADLRFVKAPLKNNLGCRLGQDENVDEDGELTYENVSSVQGGLSKLASSGPGDKAGLSSEDQHPSPWPSATLPAAKRVLRGRATCVHYVVLGLLLGCLFLAVAAICLMVRYLQVLQQLQGVHGVLESTNSSLRQELHETSAKLEQTKTELKGFKDDLEQSKNFLEREKQVGQDTQKQLEDCHRDLEETRATLQKEETQRRNLDQRLENVQSRLRRLLNCNSPGMEEGPTEHNHETDSCCPVGWVLNKSICFHMSLAWRTWEECLAYCKSLSSEMITSNPYYVDENRKGLYSTFSKQWSKPYWIHGRYSSNTGKVSRYKRCIKKVVYSWQNEGLTVSPECDITLPCICELPAFRNPEVEQLLSWAVPIRARALYR